MSAHAFAAPKGVFPAMITPLTADHAIDWDGVDRLTDWLIEAGVAGLFAVGQSGEMFHLSDAERLALARRVVERAAGRVPVVASGTFGGQIGAMADFVMAMAETGVAAVTVIAAEVAARDADERVWLTRLEELLSRTGEIPLALYECPQPYHRLIPPESLRTAAASGRFFLFKETSRSLDAVRAKIAAAEGTPLRVYNADTTGLLDTLLAGGWGYCGIAANFYPDLLAWLCAHYADSSEAAAALQTALRAFDHTLHYKYPVCAKYVHERHGVSMLRGSRSSDAVLDAYDERVFDAIMASAAQQRDTLKRDTLKSEALAQTVPTGR